MSKPNKPCRPKAGDKHYFERDGNGGFLISRSMLAMLVTILVLSGYVINSVMAYSSMQYTIQENKESVIEIQNYIDQTKVEHQSRLEMLTSAISDNNRDIKVIQTKLEFIQSDITEIKDAVKTKTTISQGK